MSAPMSASPVSPTDSESSSPSKLRSSRLNERIQRTRRHRQWAASAQSNTNTSVASGSTGSETASSQQERARTKITRVGEQFQRQKKAQALSPRSPDGQVVSPQANGGYRTQTNAIMEESPLERAVPFPDAQGKNNVFNRKLMYAEDRVSSRVVVAWPEAETDDDEDDIPVRTAPSAPKSPYTTPVTTRTWQSPLTNSEPKSRNNSLTKTPVTPGIVRAEQSREPGYKSAVDLARSRFEHSSEAATLSPMSITSEATKSSYQRGGSVTKRYAPWEKRNDKSPQAEPSKMESETPFQKYSSNTSDVGSAASSSARSATWKRPDITSASPDSARKMPVRPFSPPGVKSNVATWQKQKNADLEATSDVGSSISSGVQSAVWKRPDNVVAGGTKSAPWQKPKPSDKSESPAATGHPRPGKDADVKSPPLPKPNTGKLAPWQKPQSDTQDSGLQASASWNSPQSAPTPLKASSPTPSYEIGRQGIWQKPKSPARPKVNAIVQPDVSGRETPVQLWKRREQEMTNATGVKSEPKKVESQQIGVTHSKSASKSENVPPIRQSRDFSSPVYGRASPVPSIGKVQSPPWVKTASPGYQARAPNQTEAQQPSWVKKQTEPFESDAPSSPKEAKNTDVHATSHDNLHSPVPYDVGSTQSGYESTPFGGAVIETPKSQSVASLRASLGSKPSPPPFLATSTAVNPVKSPSGGWLSGNRKALPRSQSPHFVEQDKHAPDLPSLAVGQAISADPPTVAIDQRSTISSSSTPVRSHRMARVESDSEATPVTSHVNHRAIILMTARVTDSPSKSLADMAADSVLITDYSHFHEGTFSDYTDDEDSFVDSGIGTIMPSGSDLPNEFHGIVQKRSFEGVASQVHSHDAYLPQRDRSQPSLPMTADDYDRRENLRSRVENFSYDDDDDDDEAHAVSPARSAGRGQIQNNPTQHHAVSSKIPEPRRTPEVSNEVLDRIRSVGAATEGSDAGGSSSAVFGDPRTWGAAGGDEHVVEVPPVADRARAISAWNGGAGAIHRRSVDELDTILGGGIASPEGDAAFDVTPAKSAPHGERALSLTSMPHSSREASRILNFYKAEAEDELTGEEESLWASRDPDIDEVMMRDESPSPEPDDYDDVVNGILEEFNEDESPSAASPNSRGIHKVQFAPDPNDPFYVGTFPEVDEEGEALNPDSVFGNFWTAEGASESFDFEGADASFFSSASQDKNVGGVPENPFRVVLKPPPSAPSNRGRRQREASTDYDIRYANYLADVDEWSDFPGNVEI